MSDRATQSIFDGFPAPHVISPPEITSGEPVIGAQTLGGLDDESDMVAKEVERDAIADLDWQSSIPVPLFRKRDERNRATCMQGVPSVSTPKCSQKPTLIETLRHTFWLRDNYRVEFSLPKDITGDEIDRLCTFIGLVPTRDE